MGSGLDDGDCFHYDAAAFKGRDSNNNISFITTIYCRNDLVLGYKAVRFTDLQVPISLVIGP